MEEIKKNHDRDHDQEITKFTNKLIKKITENLENFSYNKIVANLHEMHSFMFKQVKYNYSQKTLRENYQNILILLLPVMPHFASECLEIIGVNNEKIEWPKFDEKFVHDEKVNIVIQINGKKRGLISLKENTEEDEIIDLIKKDNKLFKYLENKEIKKQIFVKNKIMNLII